jgi:hypothetical protein
VAEQKKPDAALLHARNGEELSTELSTCDVT